MGVCMLGFFNVCVFVSVSFVMCVCMCGFLKFVFVCMCGFFNVWLFC